MSDAKKPMVVRMTDKEAVTFSEPSIPHPGETPRLLLPIEDGALRVGDMLFRWRNEVAERRTDSDPEGEWVLASTLDLFDLLMGAVEGVTE